MADLVATIPRPVQLVIDDVGWREGWDLSDGGGPYRAGVDRLLGPEDYHAVADLGNALCIRPQCAMVLCEWDKNGICAEFPTTTQQGRSWDNASRIGEWAEQSAQVFVDRSANIEFAVHGVGHEHWEDGARTRAEWFGPSADHRWPWEVLQGHLECFRRILAQYEFDPSHGIPFPPSFVPCAFLYYWDSNDPESTGALVRSAGVRFCSTPFSTCHFAGGPPEKPDGGFDRGLIVLDRGGSGVAWDTYSSVPEELPTTSICGIHWPNLLMPEPAHNGEAVKMWTEYLRPIDGYGNLMLARNMAETCSQWLYHSYATLSNDGSQFHLDASAIPPVARENDLVGNPIFKMPISPGEHVSAVHSDSCLPVAYWEIEGWAFFSLQLGQSLRCSFRVEFGSEFMPLVALRNGTYDVLELRQSAARVNLTVRAYGSQTIHLRLPFDPVGIGSMNPNLKVRNHDFRASTQTAAIDVIGRNIHGEVGEIIFCSG